MQPIHVDVAEESVCVRPQTHSPERIQIKNWRESHRPWCTIHLIVLAVGGGVLIPIQHHDEVMKLSEEGAAHRENREGILQNADGAA